MKKSYAKLRRRPLFTPVWLSAAAAVAAFVVICFAIWFWSTADSTTVIVVRHAEKQIGAGDDPPLTQAGEARASLLAQMFGNAAIGRIDAIYSSPARRNQMTAAPLAARLKIPVTTVPADDPKDLARRALREHVGGRVLIVGHSDTVGPLVEALSGMKNLPEMLDDEYGTMYIVSVPRIGQANVLRVHF